MSRRRAAVAVLVGVAIALGVPGVGAPGTARADVPVPQVGWWTRSPSPPSVPEGGLAVGAAPDGELSVGAVLVDTAGGAVGAELRLVETSGASPLAAVRVCPTTTSWSAAAGEALADAPQGDCDAADAEMTRGDDGTWVADVQPLLEGVTGEVGLLVVPASGAVAFELTFAPPTVSGSVVEEPATTPEPSATPAPTPTTQAPPPSSSPSPTSPTTQAPGPSFVGPVPAKQATTTTVAPLPVDEGSSTGSEEVAFTPQLSSAVPSSADDGGGVGASTVVQWYVLAFVVGAAVSGIVWLRDGGHLTTAAMLARVRR